MNDTTKLIVFGALAYFAFFYQGGLLMKAIGPTAASPAPPPSMPKSDTQAVAGAVEAGFTAITQIFNTATQSTATRGSGVANV